MSPPSNRKKRLNPLRLDPSRTAAIRKKWEGAIKKRVRRIKSSIQSLIVEEGAFSLGNRTLGSILGANVRYHYLSIPDQVRAFRKWLVEQLEMELIGAAEAEAERAYWAAYVAEGYRKGVGRAFDEVRKAGIYTQGSVRDFYRGTKEEFLRSSFARPVGIEKVKILASRVYTELKGVTEDMAQKLTRSLTDGLAQGWSPREVARAIDKDIEGITRKRALVIARTETIRAHAEGQLDALENLGISHVGVMVEWSTAGDDLVCPLCAVLNGIVLTLKEARGIIPRHPNCRCAFMPANVGEKEKGQKRKSTSLREAIRESISRERSKGSFEEKRRKSRWAGADTQITTKRPEAVI